MKKKTRYILLGGIIGAIWGVLILFGILIAPYVINIDQYDSIRSTTSEGIVKILFMPTLISSYILRTISGCENDCLIEAILSFLLTIPLSSLIGILSAILLGRIVEVIKKK